MKKKAFHHLVVNALATAALNCSILTGNCYAQGEPNIELPTAPAVEVMTVQARDVRIWKRYPGRLEAVEQVQIRPRVRGVITKVLFEDGAQVEIGQRLFVIDPRPYNAEVESAEAALASAESQLQLASIELQRAKNLFTKKVISKSDLDIASNNSHIAQANIDIARARLRKARLELEYAYIDAPVSGRIGRAGITRGNVIEVGTSAPVLASIVATDTLYATFDVDERTYLKIARQADRTASIPVVLEPAGDSSQVYKGVMHAFDNHLDSSSGTIRAWALFKNKDGVLIPGMFTNVRLGLDSPEPLILVSERAIGTDQDKKFVYVVTPQNTVAYREVTLGNSVEGQRVVLTGLNSGDKVLINSLLRVRPDMKVRPVDTAQNNENNSFQAAIHR